MRTSKKIILILFCISLLISLMLVFDAYAKYLTSTSGTTTIPIARWNIVINNNSIRNNSSISSSIVPIFPGNSNIASNIIAPTAEGYFDLNFDFRDADVSFQYVISVTPNASSSVSDLVATGYSIDNGSITSFGNGSNTISDTILLSSNINSRSIRVYVMWDDSGSASMNNIEDTQATVSPSGNALLDVNISLTQVATSPVTP